MAAPIRVAVYGGGLAGVILARELLDAPNLDAHAFTAGESFNEVPAAATAGIVRNGLHALDLLSPQISQSFQQAGAIPMKGVRFMLAQGNDGKFIAREDSPREGTPTLSIAPLAAFIREILASLPSERMNSSKKLETIKRKDIDGPVILHFTDGTSHECDILIGADGIDSTIRRLLLGKDDPAAVPRNTGAWAIMARKTGAEGRKYFGDGLIEEFYECPWIGDGVFFEQQLLALNGEEILNLIIASYDKGAEGSERRSCTISADELRGLFENWPERLRTAVRELLCDQPDQPAMYLLEHPPANTFASGAICVMGDAAHAASPWQGPSNGMMLEDVVILSALLGRATSPAEAIIALKTYDVVRRPRTQRVVNSSRDTGPIMTGHGEGIGLDLKQLQAKLLPRWDFMVDFDVAKHRSEAIEKMEDLLRGSTG
ncbi:hypothetical protein N0V93_009074 [Gnomoniopsis smithogilvyi]|uniref:FAD-binding domain-containing protein n=1 Tax=Gnomoniopsis smithogilvyi TaxID=1191159 RepID=A0A9W8YJS4_9PEZI|nr:hypothetical protein N0V93_009074 [Gnomoniopsis smithogilvyi]